MMSAIPSSRWFFCAVESCANFAAAARARSSFSRVDKISAAVPAMLAFLRLRREIGPNLVRNGFRDAVGLASVHNCCAHAGIARHLRSAQLRTHSAATEFAVTVAKCLHLRRQLADGAHQARTLAIGRKKSVHVCE